MEPEPHHFRALRTPPPHLHSSSSLTESPAASVQRESVSAKSLRRVRLFATPGTVAHQAPLSMEFFWQDYWSRLPFPSPGDLPNPGIEPGSPPLQADALPSKPIALGKWTWRTGSQTSRCWLYTALYCFLEIPIDFAARNSDFSPLVQCDCSFYWYLSFLCCGLKRSLCPERWSCVYLVFPLSK